MAALQAKLQANKGLIQAGHYGGGGEIASPIPRSMRLDVPKFSGTDPDRWIFSITEYFTLLSTPEALALEELKQRQFLYMMQHLNPQTVHIKPPDDDYVAPATSLTLEKKLNEFGEECFDITRVDDKANGNPVKDR
nr:prolyl oligopeptidase family protein [Tanacetum cinerariifolium]